MRVDGPAIWFIKDGKPIVKEASSNDPEPAQENVFPLIMFHARHRDQVELMKGRSFPRAVVKA